ncbi:hypothetical protein BBK36DRAFT_1177502 [Trichoderma citrinoviride]|uniref:Uncharacterized protein n=1 Tax=Trichoderma citrinoviride TaxID=58853 RepID=A0A2T4B648_9HYPO|nr:hypothetical protein BBK36DRAFT_1177502 [Trichoderma citrinoviride]PTB64802.1 hypothetical protein BBK36DRAFT_1177502 [Trichoderma citrinoviride]
MSWTKAAEGAFLFKSGQAVLRQRRQGDKAEVERRKMARESVCEEAGEEGKKSGDLQSLWGWTAKVQLPSRCLWLSAVPVLRKAATLKPGLTPDHGVTEALRATGQLMAASGQRAKGCWGGCWSPLEAARGAVRSRSQASHSCWCVYRYLPCQRNSMYEDCFSSRIELWLVHRLRRHIVAHSGIYDATMRAETCVVLAIIRCINRHIIHSRRRCYHSRVNAWRYLSHQGWTSNGAQTESMALNFRVTSYHSFVHGPYHTRQLHLLRCAMPLGARIPYLVRRDRGIDGVDEQLDWKPPEQMRYEGRDHAVDTSRACRVMTTEQLPLTKDVRPSLVGICHVAVSDFDNKQRTLGPCWMFQIGSIERQTSRGHDRQGKFLKSSVLASHRQQRFLGSVTIVYLAGRESKDQDAASKENLDECLVLDMPLYLGNKQMQMYFCWPQRSKVKQQSVVCRMQKDQDVKSSYQHVDICSPHGTRS